MWIHILSSSYSQDRPLNLLELVVMLNYLGLVQSRRGNGLKNLKKLHIIAYFLYKF